MLYSKDDLIADLHLLSPIQLRDVAAHVKRLLDNNSSPERLEFAGDSFPSSPSPVPSTDLFLSLDPANLVVRKCDLVVVDTLGDNPLGKSFLQIVDPDYRQTANHAFQVQFEGVLIVEGPPGACFTVRFRLLENIATDNLLLRPAPMSHN
jgi:hypothetical protein